MKIYNFTGILFLSFFATLLNAQEICDNGIDDDANGLIDLNDINQCGCDFNPPSLIPNPSFEDTLCCPTNNSQLTCADTWIQATKPTSDYFNLCGWNGILFSGFLPAPQPLPGGGNAWAGFFNRKGWKEYLGACLLSSMKTGSSYTIDFDLAFSGGQTTTEIVIYGSTNCSNLPINTYDCPLTAPGGGWIKLGSQTLNLNSGSWDAGSITFTPPVDINAITIGPNCTDPNTTGAVMNYYYIDNLILDLTKEVQIAIIESGNLCNRDLVLNATADSLGGSWQWYLNGIALVGETADSLDISANNYGVGTYTAHYIFKGGGFCNEHELLNLNSTSGFIDVQTACKSYTWINGNAYTSNNNTATDTIFGGAVNGCDSIVTLDLTILSSSNSIDKQTACKSYTWIDGNAYTSNNNTATDTIFGGAVNGCDSIVTLDLTILSSSNSIDIQTACKSYTWIDGNAYTSNNNTATDTIFGGTVNGCDSIVTLDLTILSSSNSIDKQTACKNYTWINGNAYTSNNNTATDTIFGGAVNGCDSIITLDLTMTPNLTISLGDDTYFCNDSVLLSPGNDYASYLWSDGSTNSSLMVGAQDEYEVTVIDTAGCIGSDEVLVLENCPFVLWVPNAFTPNGDDNNKVFSVVSKNILSLEVIIFNRWGEIIFSWKNLKGFWDGRNSRGEQVQDGVYPYTINYSYKSDKGVLIQNQKIGHVTLLK